MKAAEAVLRCESLNEIVLTNGDGLPTVPVVFTREAQNWPALERWTDEYLVCVIGQAEMPIHVAHYGVTYPAVQRMTIEGLLTALKNAAAEREDPICALAGYPLELISVRLLQDVIPPLFDWGDVSVIPYLWMGPKAKIVPFHFDKVSGVLVNVRGRKQMTFVSPASTSLMRPLPSNPYLSQMRDLPGRSSVADIIESGGIVQQSILHPGESIFVPQGWWHQVEYLDMCISVNFWPRAYGSRE